MTLDNHVKSLLEERGKRYGSYALNTRRFWSLAALVNLHGLSQEYPEEAYALMMVLVKVSRLANKVDDAESWIDICGYATLALGGHDDKGRASGEARSTGQRMDKQTRTQE